jgi:hypothetical protein
MELILAIGEAVGLAFGMAAPRRSAERRHRGGLM